MTCSLRSVYCYLSVLAECLCSLWSSTLVVVLICLSFLRAKNTKTDPFLLCKNKSPMFRLQKMFLRSFVTEKFGTKSVTDEIAEGKNPLCPMTCINNTLRFSSCIASRTHLLLKNTLVTHLDIHTVILEIRFKQTIDCFAIARWLIVRQFNKLFCLASQFIEAGNSNCLVSNET